MPRRRTRPKAVVKKFFAVSRAEWRDWLEQNHSTVRSIDLVRYKKHTGKVCVSYDAAVEEALCFGWIDSVVHRLDSERYCIRFFPRRSKGSKFSKLNVTRVKRMIAAGKMRNAGLKLFQQWIDAHSDDSEEEVLDEESEDEDELPVRDVSLTGRKRSRSRSLSSGRRKRRRTDSKSVVVPVPVELSDALRENDAASDFFDELAPSYRKRYCLWISSAKRPATRTRRAGRAVGFLERRVKILMA